MKIILTNDDGIDAPGLEALWSSVQNALSDQSPEIIVVAPDRGRSECGHSVTQGRPLVIKQVKPSWYSVDGTPVDCVRVAMTTLMKEPTLVFSGINQGANLGVNLTVSGTFAAAREAALHNIPAVAISHYRRPDVPKNWAHCSDWLATTLSEFAATARMSNSQTSPLWNVNLPATNVAEGNEHAVFPTIQWCHVDRCPIPRQARQDGEMVSFDLDFHSRPREVGSDVDHCFAGQMTISKVSPYFS
ncbi:MAG: 5'/3'-nucleotidase SurE [Pirellulaceae bacterium]